MRLSLLLLTSAIVACRDTPVGHRLEGPLFSPTELAPCAADAQTSCGVESRGVLDLPNQGFQSFYGVTLPLARHPKARVAYTRFFWQELEPTEGELRFEILEAAIEAARAEGQTFSFRVMSEDSGSGEARVPAWLVESAGGTWGTHGGGGRYFSPHYDDPQFLASLERTVAALGTRYDGDPRIAAVDVGFVGDSGEWAYVVDGAAMPSPQSRQRILTAFSRAFVRTPVLMLIGAVDDGGDPLKEAVALGMGWRADCWGDLRRGWNHHDDFYEQQLAASGAGEVWRAHPVAVETCGEMELWDLLGYDEAQVRWVLRWALDHHVSLINNKSRAVPTKWRPLVDEYLSFAGPRLFVREAKWSSGAMRIALDNRGSTPPYQAWTLALRARGGSIVRAPSTLASLTGTTELTLALPPASGAWDVAVLDEQGAPLPLANEGVREDGWLEISKP